MLTSINPQYNRTDTLTQMPRQKLSRKDKTEEWMKACVDAAISSVNLYGDSGRRSPSATKLRNYRLFNNQIDKSDFEHLTNPYKLKDFTAPASLQAYDVVSRLFSTLLGEESKRQFNPVIRAINEEAITGKANKQKELLIQALNEMLMAEIKKAQGEQPQEQPQTPEQVERYMRYHYKDIREKLASNIYSYLKRYLKLDNIFQDGYKDSLIAAEEIYCIDEISGEPIVYRCNPLELFFILPHNSDHIDEAEIVVEQTEASLSKIVDDYYEYLTEDQIKLLENQHTNSDFIAPITPAWALNNGNNMISGGASLGTTTPTNIKVYKCTWASFRKMGKLKYIDPFTGEEQIDEVSEEYRIPRGDTTQSIEWFWIKEYYYGVKLGAQTDIYLRLGPKKNQFRATDNHSRCRSGYVGTVYNATNAIAVSLMDRLAPWIYQYISAWYRLELLMASNMGNIAQIDIARMPDGWEIDKWLYYASMMHIMFTDSFAEGKKGYATGKLAGNMQNTDKVLPLEVGNSIQHYINVLAFLENKLKETSGITDQRLGDISPTELVGNTERAVTQSANITETWFRVHNNTKLRVIECLIEVAKNCWKDKSKKLQYITDDMATVFFEVDGNVLMDAEYGVFVTNSAKDHEVAETLKGLLQAAIQNDKIQLSEVIDIIETESIADTKDRLKKSEENFHERQMQIAKAQEEGQQKMADAQHEHEAWLMENENWNKQLDRENKIQLEELRAYQGQESLDQDGNGVPDPVELSKLSLEQSRLAFEKREADRLHTREQSKQKLEEKRLAQEKVIKEKEIAVKKIAAKKKPASPKK